MHRRATILPVLALAIILLGGGSWESANFPLTAKSGDAVESITTYAPTTEGQIRYSCTISKLDGHEKVHFRSLAFAILDLESSFILEGANDSITVTFEASTSDGVPFVAQIPYYHSEAWKEEWALQRLESTPPGNEPKVFKEDGQWYVWQGWMIQCWLPSSLRAEFEKLKRSQFDDAARRYPK